MRDINHELELALALVEELRAKIADLEGELDLVAALANERDKLKRWPT